MKKFRRAVFCYLILWAYAPRTARALVPWILNIKESRRAATLQAIGADSRARISDWAFAEFFEKPLDFNIVIHILGGDEYYERNKRDVARLQREIGCPIVEIFDTHPIFAKYPHLRGFARNKKFEAIWEKQKQR
ncbi:MAG: hypothetical protein FWG80_02775 [Alphaproteobacteria bacterium]|nr:hypothetical protein [Alphaproteobacteria bacterium]